MAGRWKEVVRLRFKGDRFRDHALDLSALSELTQFQKMVAETAKALWRAANPDRERLPSHFEDRTRLCLREIHEGSAVAPLEVFTTSSLVLELGAVVPIPTEPPLVAKYAEPLAVMAVLDAYGIVIAAVVGAVTSAEPL